MNVYILPIKRFLRIEHLPEKAAAVISTAEGVDRSHVSVPCVIAEYMDFDYESPQSFSDRQAAEFAAFVKALPHETTDLYICCDAGQSRSAGIAAAILRWLGRSDMPVWSSPKYQPNALCFYKMLQALGLDITDPEMDERIYLNREAFRNAIRRQRAE